MKKVTIISGSTLGSAEYVAEHLASLLDSANITNQVIHGAQWHELSTDDLWLIVTSTHGAGDLPDNLQPLYDELQQQLPDLHQLEYAAIGLGSQEYDTFCGAIEKLDKQLQQLGAKRIGQLSKIDVTEHEIPEDPAELWLATWLAEWQSCE